MNLRFAHSITVLLLLCTALPAQNNRETQIDTLRRESVSLGTNLLYWGSSTPNIHAWLPLGDNFTVGITGGLKAWPRWLPWDNDPKVNSKWRHFAIVPQLRWWPKANYSGFFAGADLLWTHYNVGGVTFPFGMYPQVRENRLQGDFLGLGIALGYSWWLTRNLRLEAEVGAAAGYNTAHKYQCSWCGADLGQVSGPGIVPKLGLNLAYSFFRRKERPEEIQVIESPADTLKRPDPVDVPPEFMAALPLIEDWKGIAGQLEKDHSVLRPSSEYQPYTPDRILRKEEAPLYVFFHLDKSVLLRDFRDNASVLDEIMHITSSILADTTSSVTKIQIIGLASVEGSPKHNLELSRARALALQRYIQDRLPITDDMFDTVGGGEAWTEFRDELNDLALEGGGAGLSSEELRGIIELIDSEPSPAKREAKLKRAAGGKYYTSLRDHILANQRNSGYLRIYYDYVPDESAREINEGIALLEKKDYAAALEVLEAKKDDPRSLNAYAVALFYNGREQEAMELLRQASATDESAAANLRQLEDIAAKRAAYEQYLRDMQEYANLRYGR